MCSVLSGLRTPAEDDSKEMVLCSKLALMSSLSRQRSQLKMLTLMGGLGALDVLGIEIHPVVRGEQQ